MKYKKIYPWMVIGVYFKEIIILNILPILTNICYNIP